MRCVCLPPSAGSGPGYDSVFSVVLLRTLQRSDAGCKSPPPSPHSLSLPPFLSRRLIPYLNVLSFLRSEVKGDTCKHGRGVVRLCFAVSSSLQCPSLSFSLSISHLLSLNSLSLCSLPVSLDHQIITRAVIYVQYVFVYTQCCPWTVE